jgi:hypothetical protein
VGEAAETGRAEVVAAQAQVLAARALLEDEIVRLEASARAAVDVRAKVRRNPVKAAGTAAGVAFVVVGGPRRVLRRTRHAIFGRPAPLPPSMLPKEIDTAIGKLGTDGDKVRGTIEREFARYLDENAPRRRRQNILGIGGDLLMTFGRFFALRYGRMLAEEVFKTDSESFGRQMDRVRAKRAQMTSPPKGDA